jgi:heme A synthase
MLIEFVIFIAVLGLIWWLVTTYIPMPPAGKTILTVVFVVVLVVALLQLFGITDLRLRK